MQCCLCCDCVFCNSLVFYVSTFYFILWAVVSAGYPALLSSSYFERINDDDDDDDDDPVFSRFSRTPTCDRQTDTDRPTESRARISYAALA